MTSPTNPNQKLFFQSKLEDFPNPWTVESLNFEQLSSSSGWRVMAKKAPAIIVAGAGVKRRTNEHTLRGLNLAVTTISD